MDYGLSLLSTENLELKKSIIGLLIKKTRTLDKLMELGTKHAVQSSLYDLEQEGFITRKIRSDGESNIFYYVFNRSKLLFKIQKDLENNYQKIKEKMNYYTSNSNSLFYCNKCNKLFEYTAAIERAFKCCDEALNSFDTKEIVHKLKTDIAYIEDKLNNLAKI